MVGPLRAAALVGSVALIAGATLLPFWGMPAARIPPTWCLRCGDLWLTDVISNLALFVPFGVALSRRGAAWWRPVLLSLLCSATVESLQFLGVPPGRSPALADILTNTAGGWLGAVLARVWRAERDRPAHQARWLAIAWTGFAMVVTILTAMALQPVSLRPPAEPLALRQSPLTHVPGHGWYAGITDSARVGTHIVRQGERGPIIGQIAGPRLPLAASVWVRGTDGRPGEVPVLFLHRAGDSTAWLQIAKRGDHAELTVHRRSHAWGLRLPPLVLRQAFRGRAGGDPRPLGLHAVVSDATLTLRSAGSRRDSVSLPLSPALGWALAQSVVSPQSPVGPVVAFGWMLFLLGPIGWWSLCARARMSLPAALGLLLILTLVAVPRGFDVHPFTPADWGRALAALGAGGGVAIASRTGRRDQPPSDGV